MSKVNNIAMNPGQAKFETFRSEYSTMEYLGYKSKIDTKGLHVSYEFSLDGKYFFSPGFSLPRRRFITDFPDEQSIQSPIFKTLLFHIGMIELISYWKVACPKKVIIKGQKLSEKQVDWWKQVYFHGLGEFFYTNGIQTSITGFMEIFSEGELLQKQTVQLDDTVIIPVGGGKDSVVTLEMIGRQFKIRPFIMNPRGATLECVRVAGYGNDGYIEVNRRIDPLLIEMNSKGFLNGHTPFSALLAFYTLLVSTISGHKHIALSNESSANEPTIPGTEVNHQYSKSYSFESDFRQYVADYISDDFNYFSFLRPLNELQIARIFAEQVKYYSVFKSCNAGSKTDIWCGACPKCLFAFIILSPFIPMIELTHIFGKNLFEDPKMLTYLKELSGIDDNKPFECVGTIDEVNAALHMYIANHKNQKLPLLIDYYSNTTNYLPTDNINQSKVLGEFNDLHFLKPEFLEIVIQKIHE